MSTSNALLTTNSHRSSSPYHEAFLNHLSNNPLAMMLRAQEGAGTNDSTSNQHSTCPTQQQLFATCKLGGVSRPNFFPSSPQLQNSISSPRSCSNSAPSELSQASNQHHENSSSSAPSSPATLGNNNCTYKPYHSVNKLEELKRIQASRASLRVRRNVNVSPLKIPVKKPKKTRKKPGAVDWAKIRARVQEIRMKKKSTSD